MLVILYQITRLNTSENSNIETRRGDNLKSQRIRSAAIRWSDYLLYKDESSYNKPN